MKKLLIIALASFSLLGLVACGNQSGVETTKASTVAQQEEKDNVKNIISASVPTQNTNEYSVSGFITKVEKDSLTIETERGTEISIPSKDLKTTFKADDNVLVTLKMDISKAVDLGDVEVVSVTKL